MPSYLLDTDTVSYALRGEGRVASRLLDHRPSELAVSSLTLAELRFGAAHKRSRRLHRLIDTFVATVQVVPFDAQAAESFGPMAAALRAAGTPIGPIDSLIAAHALSLACVMVTNNTRHFARVKGLKSESWA